MLLFPMRDDLFLVSRAGRGPGRLFALALVYEDNGAIISPPLRISFHDAKTRVFPGKFHELYVTVVFHQQVSQFPLENYFYHLFTIS